MKQHLLNSLILLFALIAGGTSSWAESETITFSTLSLENGVQYTDPFGTNISVTFAGGGNDGKYYTTGSGIRTYGDGTITITAKGNTITAISTTFSAAGNAPAADDVWTCTGTGTGTSGVNASWSGSATEVVLTRPSGSGHWRLQSITVNYTTGGVTPVASIDLESNSIETPAAGASGTIEVTYNNITDVTSEVQFFEADGTTPATYDWVSAGINTSNNVEYTIAANKGAARTAYMKVYALDDEANDVYSELITITQAKYEIPTSWAAVTSIADLTASDVFVIVGDNGSTFALSNDNGTSAAPTAVAVTVANNALSGTVADNIKWNISGNATDGYTFYPDGDTEKWLYCTNTNNGVRVGTNTNNTFTLDASGYLKHVGTSRYVGIYNDQDWRCYTGNGGNIADQTFAFYKKLAVKFNAEGYATFSSTCAIDYSKAEGWTAWVVTSVSGSAITFSQVTGAVPAGTGVLLMGTAGETVYPEVAASGVAPAVNKLQGITTTTEVVADAYYGLSGAEFVKVNAGTVPAGKALLPAAEVGSVKALSFRFDGADGISEIIRNGENEKMSAIYDLSGRRVVKPTKGLYIVNGKKVVK